MFSVLISVFNKENAVYLESSLKSILIDQTLLSNDVVIVKDGVLNNDLDYIIEKYFNLFPDVLNVIGYSENKGLGYSLNFGLEFCKNDIVIRMDTDDVAHPERFSKLIAYFNDHPEYALIGSYIEEFIDQIGDLKRNRVVPLTHEMICAKKKYRNPFNHMSVGFRKSIITECGGYKEMPFYEDYYLWLRVLNTNKGMNINESLVFARVGNNMISRRQGYDLFLAELNFQCKLLNNKLISNFDFFFNFFLRGIPRLLPLNFLKFIYHYFLRI